MYERGNGVSVLFDEPKLLNANAASVRGLRARFSALRRAEIAEPVEIAFRRSTRQRFSALRRAEIAESYSATRA